MNIVTGYTGSAHVTSNAAQALNQGIFGTGNGVLDIGNKFAATLADANTVTIQDGEGIMQGVHFRIDPGDTEDVTISNGTSGYYRIDLICARYTKNASTGVEDVSLVVIEGTPDASSATAPSYNTGDIRDGDSPVDFPLYQVSLNGLTPTLSPIFIILSYGCVLPFDALNTDVYTNGCEIVIRPDIKMMTIHVSAYNVSGSQISSSGYTGIMGNLPPVATKKGAFDATLHVYDPLSGSISTAVALFHFTYSNGIVQRCSLSIQGTVPAGYLVEGVITVPYLKLTDTYPLSSATPIYLYNENYA